jgi:hypothetical protein
MWASTRSVTWLVVRLIKAIKMDACCEMTLRVTEQKSVSVFYESESTLYQTNDSPNSTGRILKG